MPVPVSAPGGHGAQGPSFVDKMKMGGIMGGTVGLCIGFIFGSYSMITHGPGPNGIIRTLGQYMLGSAATFGFFMSIGTAIRTEAPPGASPIALEAFARARKAPILMWSQQQKETSLNRR